MRRKETGAVFLLDLVQLGPKPLSMVGRRESPPLTDRRMRQDLRVLARMIRVYCQDKHDGVERSRVRFKGHHIEPIVGSDVVLCPACGKLLMHALMKRSMCPLDPKPSCKNCTEHCYHPAYRERIRDVMKYSGRKLVLSGRIDYLLHLLF